MKFFVLLLTIAFLSPALSFAKSTKGGGHAMKMEEPSKEMREDMAEHHEEMASCLRSDKAFSECHKQMMENCPMGKDGKCPMMNHGHGKSHGKGAKTKDHSEHAH